MRDDESRCSDASSQPQFQPERVHSIQIVPEEAFVMYEAEVLVKPQRGFIRDFRFQNDLKQTSNGRSYTPQPYLHQIIITDLAQNFNDKNG